MPSSLSLGQFVKELTALLEDSKIAIPFKNERSWHFLFYELKKEENVAGKPAFLNGLQFDWDGAYPKSQRLSDFLHSLHWNASVSASNPHYETINLSDGVKALWLKKYEQENAETKQYLSSVVDRARKEFGQESAVASSHDQSPTSA
jgi:hypothetical protein